jgi:hypothetical protein
MAEIAAKEVRYIKLGAGGAWAAISIERGEIPPSFKFAALRNE